MTITPAPDQTLSKTYRNDQLFQMMDVFLAHIDRLSLPALVRHLVSLDLEKVDEATAELVAELLTEGGYPAANPPTYTAILGLLKPIWNETIDASTRRCLQAATTAIGLGLHTQGGGWMLRTLLEDPEERFATDWIDLVAAVRRGQEIVGRNLAVPLRCQVA